MSSIEWTLNEYNTIRISECDLEVRNSLTGHIIIFFPHQEHAMLINSPPHHIPKKKKFDSNHCIGKTFSAKNGFEHRLESYRFKGQMPFVSIMPQIARRSDGVTLLFLLVKKTKK